MNPSPAVRGLYFEDFAIGAEIRTPARTITQTDIVMLLTPHILRAPAITEADLRPIYIGSQGNLGIGGPPPLIGAPQGGTTAPAPAQTAAPASPLQRSHSSAPSVCRRI